MLFPAQQDLCDNLLAGIPNNPEGCSCNAAFVSGFFDVLPSGQGTVTCNVNIADTTCPVTFQGFLGGIDALTGAEGALTVSGECTANGIMGNVGATGTVSTTGITVNSCSVGATPAMGAEVMCTCDNPECNGAFSAEITCLQGGNALDGLNGDCITYDQVISVINNALMN